MNSWIIGGIALVLWGAASLLYLRPSISRALAARRKRREALAAAKAQQAKGG